MSLVLSISTKTKVRRCAVFEMAEGVSKDPDPFSCSICLDLLRSPVTIQCGHSYCMSCINGYWDREDQKAVYSCPQCRHTFTTRPVLNKSTVLAEVVEKLMAGAKNDPPVLAQEAGPGDVECDFCTVRKLKAVKSCLVCLASYCATHVQPHYESAVFKRHKLVESSTSIQDKICSRHDKLLEVYCRTDGRCICLLCVMDEHRGHDTVSAAAERTEKQKLFGKKKQKYQQGIQERERGLRQLRQTMKGLKCCAEKATDGSEKTFAEMILSLEIRSSAMKELIRVQEKAAMSRAEGLVDRLEKEIAELRKRDNELKQLSLTEDHIRFLQSWQSIFDRPESEEFSVASINLHMPFDFVTKALSDVRDRLENLSKAIAEISEKIQINVDPKTRQEFSMYSCQLSLDPNTAFENLLLSEGNSKVTWRKKAQSYPYHPERFTEFEQVLCSEGLTGVCYWEVEWKGPRVEVVASYKGIGLEECGFGYSDQSWCMSLSLSGCRFWHSGIKTKISAPFSSRVGVYLNHNAGILSFYSVSDSGKMMLLHRVQTIFSHPLYPGFMVSRGSSVSIVQPE